MKALNRQNVANLPVYPERILQFGEGNFLRAFVDWMVDKMNKEADFNSGVTVVQPIDRGMVDMLNDQDGLYHLYLQGIKDGEVVSESTLINAIQKGINPYTEYDSYVESIENPELRFVLSNTTEAGISFDENDRLDMTPQNSFPGKMTALLYRRFKKFEGAKDKGLIILACELIEHNGDVLKEIVLKYAELWELETEFVNWLNEACAFCSTLVDRIVPGYPRDTINEIQEELGYKDNLVVMGEYFHVWVIESPEWAREELPFDKAGLNVIFTDDMTAYRDRKVRILNGAHTGTFATAYMYGIDTVKDAFEDDVVGKYMNELVFEEICPNINLPQEDLKVFAAEILERFKNPYIKHLWLSIALNAMSKWETRVQPTLVDFVERTGKLPKRTAFSLAAMMAFYKGSREGVSFDVVDNKDILDLYSEAWAEYDNSAEATRKVVEKVLAYDKNFKTNLNFVEGLTDLVSAYLYKIQNDGMQSALRAMLDSSEDVELKKVIETYC